MSRTYRRRGERYEYTWVLREWKFEYGHRIRVEIDRHSVEGQRAIARFHSDAQATMKGSPRSCAIFASSSSGTWAVNPWIE